MKYIALALSTVLLFGCGGGGGGGAPAASAKVVSTETFLLKQAYANYFNNTKTETSTITGTVTVVDNGSSQAGTITGNGSATSSAITSTTFEGVAALQKTRAASGSITIVAGGQSATQALPATSLTHYATPTDFLPLGNVASTGGYTVVTAPASIPVTAKVNDSGMIASYVTFASSAKGAPANTSVLTYQLAADTASTAILNLTETVKTTGGVVLSTTTWSHRMTPAGALSHLNDLATTTFTSGTSTLSMVLTLTY